jgi:uncharacterized protein
VNDLILSVDALEEANQPFEADLPRDFLDEVLSADPPTEYSAAGASHVRGRATKMGRKVLVQAKYSVPLKGLCKRTYVPAEQLAPKKPKVEGDVEATFDPEATDEEGYKGKEIDLAGAIREQILLSVPPSPLCSEDCKGLCPKCGKDLNEGECGCDRTVLDPRWGALKGIQLEKKEK